MSQSKKKVKKNIHRRVKVRPLSRRAMLRGAGGVMVGLPLLSAMSTRKSEAQGDPARVIFVFRGCGVGNNWWPSGGERDFTLTSSMQPLAPYRDKLIIPANITNATAKDRRGDGGNGHDVGTGHALTCRPIVAGPQGVGEFGHLYDGSAGGISIDQELAQKIGGGFRFPSLEFGVKAQNIRQNLPSRISYKGRFQPVQPLHTPSAAFDFIFRNFMPPSQDPTDNTALINDKMRQQSVVGAVLSEYRRLRGLVSRNDQLTLDAHIEGLAQMESRINAIDVSGMPGGAVCEVPGEPPSTGNGNNEYPENTRLQMELMANAFACNMTRVQSLQWNTGQPNIRFSFLGHSDGNHSLSHEGASNTTAQRQLNEIDQWYSEQLAYLCGLLEMHKEPSGKSLLDNTVICLVNEIQGVANRHQYHEMPYLLIGDAGGRLNSGRFVQSGATRSTGELFTTIKQVMGVDENVFGDPDFCDGAISTLLA